MFSKVLALLFVATAANAASLNPAQGFHFTRVINGDNALIEDLPYQISLQYGTEHMCGGSIIANEWIVTAGHCVEVPNKNHLYVRAGTSFVQEGGTIHRVAKVIRHPSYMIDRNENPLNDIALIKLADPIVYDDKHKAIELYNKSDKTRAGEMGIISGWGVTADLRVSFQLQSAVLPIVDTSVCNAAYRFHGGLPSKQICAAFYGVGGKDSCQGDSGGPLAIGNRLAGIISWGYGCAHPKYPGVYTEVAAHRDWIEQTMAKY